MMYMHIKIQPLSPAPSPRPTVQIPATVLDRLVELTRPERVTVRMPAVMT